MKKRPISNAVTEHEKSAPESPKPRPLSVLLREFAMGLGYVALAVFCIILLPPWIIRLLDFLGLSVTVMILALERAVDAVSMAILKTMSVPLLPVLRFLEAMNLLFHQTLLDWIKAYSDWVMSV